MSRAASLLVMVACQALLAGCWEGDRPDLRVTVSNELDAWMNGTASIRFSASTGLLVNETFPVALPPRERTRVFETWSLEGQGNLTLSWAGADGVTGSRSWPNWRGGDDYGYRVISYQPDGLRFKEPTP